MEGIPPFPLFGYHLPSYCAQSMRSKYFYSTPISWSFYIEYKIFLSHLLRINKTTIYLLSASSLLFCCIIWQGPVPWPSAIKTSMELDSWRIFDIDFYLLFCFNSPVYWLESSPFYLFISFIQLLNPVLWANLISNPFGPNISSIWFLHVDCITSSQQIP